MQLADLYEDLASGPLNCMSESDVWMASPAVRHVKRDGISHMTRGMSYLMYGGIDFSCKRPKRASKGSQIDETDVQKN